MFKCALYGDLYSYMCPLWRFICALYGDLYVPFMMIYMFLCALYVGLYVTFMMQMAYGVYTACGAYKAPLYGVRRIYSAYTRCAAYIWRVYGIRRKSAIRLYTTLRHSYGTMPRVWTRHVHTCMTCTHGHDVGISRAYTVPCTYTRLHPRPTPRPTRRTISVTCILRAAPSLWASGRGGAGTGRGPVS